MKANIQFSNRLDNVGGCIQLLLHFTKTNGGLTPVIGDTRVSRFNTYPINKSNREQKITEGIAVCELFKPPM